MKDVKKIELHLHLEGAAPPAFIRGLATEKGTDLSAIFDNYGHYAYRDFDDFLRVYEAATSVIRTPQDYARLVREVLGNCAEQGAIYAELFVSPEFCGGGDLAAWRDYLGAMEEAAAEMAAQGIDSRAILTLIRHFGPERGRATAICAAETGSADRTGWVTGVGLAGAEAVGRPQDFAWSFDCAREAGLGLTCHAGEWDGPQSVRDALSLGVSRIGHGVRSIEDPSLLDELAQREIVLEICPGSNVALGVYPDWSAHPIARLTDAGIRVTVSTDDPPFFHTTLNHEYERLAEVFRWGRQEFSSQNITAAGAAFCDTETHARLLAQLS
ncbi:MAG: adenosine deaminase [Paracoccus sp. (in: a-proteobacteria)]